MRSKLAPTQTHSMGCRWVAHIAHAAQARPRDEVSSVITGSKQGARGSCKFTLFETVSNEETQLLEDGVVRRILVCMVE